MILQIKIIIKAYEFVGKSDQDNISLETKSRYPYNNYTGKIIDLVDAHNTRPRDYSPFTSKFKAKTRG